MPAKVSSNSTLRTWRCPRGEGAKQSLCEVPSGGEEQPGDGQGTFENQLPAPQGALAEMELPSRSGRMDISPLQHWERTRRVFVWLGWMPRVLEDDLEELSPSGQPHVRFGAWISLQNPTNFPTNPVWDPILFFTIPWK